MQTQIIILGTARTLSAQLAALQPLGIVPSGREIAAGPVACRIGKRVFPFVSYAEASKAYCAARDAIGATSSDERYGPVAPKCEIIDANGKCLAFISYNGKVWKGPINNDNYDCLHNPYAGEAS